MGISTKQLAECYRNMGHPEPIMAACGSYNKYNVAPKEERTVDGIVFASKMEARCYSALRVSERAGVITGLELQPRFILQDALVLPGGKKQRAIAYVADFRFRQTADGRVRIIDVNGRETPVFKQKMKMFRAKFPELEVEIWR